MPEIAQIKLNSALKDAVDAMIHGTGLTSKDNGDRIEILTSPSSKGPSLDWLSIAKSASTRNKINQWFKRENKDDNI